jgi:hypothetical protein
MQSTTTLPPALPTPPATTDKPQGDIVSVFLETINGPDQTIRTALEHNLLAFQRCLQNADPDRSLMHYTSDNPLLSEILHVIEVLPAEYLREILRYATDKRELFLTRSRPFNQQLGPEKATDADRPDTHLDEPTKTGRTNKGT